jgi:hypothetical protein
MPVPQGELTSLSRTSGEVLIVCLAYLVQPRLRRNGHSHDVEMRSGRHAVPLDIRGSGSFLYSLYLLDVLCSDVVKDQLPCLLFTIDKDGFNHTTQHQMNSQRMQRTSFGYSRCWVIGVRSGVVLV